MSKHGRMRLEPGFYNSFETVIEALEIGGKQAQSAGFVAHGACLLHAATELRHVWDDRQRETPAPATPAADRRRPFKHLDDSWTEVPCLINPEPVSPEVREIQDAPLSISFFQDCGHSPAWQMIPSVLVELDQSGLGFHPYQGPVWNDPCLMSHDEAGRPTGFLVYRYNSERSSWFVMLAYVIPEARRQGIHTALFQALIDRARKRGDILMIESGTHIDNLTAQAAFAAQGRKKVAISFEYRLLDRLPGKSHLDLEQEAGP